MPRKIIPKPYNSGTMTSPAFFGWLRSILRRASMRWKPISEAKMRARRSKPSTTIGRHKFEYQCNHCKKWFPEKVGKTKMIAVDHIEDCGSLKCAEDLPGFVTRLFCEVNGLQILCSPCHNKKTHKK